MARRKKEAKDDPKRDLVVRARQRTKVMMDADRENRQAAVADLRFLHVPGAQWEDYVKRERGDLRPCYEFNKLRITVKRIVNDMRANRPQGKVRAVNDGAVETAEGLEGVIRNVWNTSDGDTIIDYAAEYQVGCGMGAWRITTDYMSDDSFDQMPKVLPIRNPFCLFADPSAQDFMKRDAEDWSYTDKISKASFEARYPDVEPCSFEETEFEDDEDWETDERVRICEYWYKEPVLKTLYLLDNGATVDAATEDGDKAAIERAGLKILKERQVKSHKIMMCIVGGTDKLLEGPTEWAGTQHPFIQVYGEYVIIEGKAYWFGLARNGKDAQRSYNYSRTNAIESVALAPQAKYWATAKQAAGLTDQWAVAHKTNMPFMLYNADSAVPGPPVRMGSADVPVALIQEMQLASEDIKAVTGIYDASLGAQGNETSGKAINARQRQGEIATYNYMDNLAKGIQRTWELLVDICPKVIDTERTLRILGHDGAEDYVTFNKIDPATGNTINDLSTGTFDVTVTVGPSFATVRQEAAEVYSQMANTDQNLMLVAGDLVHKSMDYPYSQEIAERYRAMLPPQIQQMLGKDKKLPPEVQAAMAQVQQMSQMVEQKGQLVTAAEQELKELQASAKGDAASAKLAQANLKTQEVEFAAQLDKVELAKKDLALAQQQLEAEKAIFAKEVENSLLKIKLAHTQAEHSLTETAHHHDTQAMQAEHGLESKARDLQDTAKDAQHGLEKQATENAVQNMQAAHKQQLSQAKQPPAK